MKNKIKTHKASVKRFKVKKSGDIVHYKQGNNDHLRVKKTRNRKARLSGTSVLSSTEQSKKIKKIIN